MKRRLYILWTVCLAGVLALSSCSDWFDISPKTDVKAEEFYKDESGFMSALAGLYIKMTNAEAYGSNLSNGMLEQMAQAYDRLPDGADSRTDVYIYLNNTQGGYNTKEKLKESWGELYNIIANANNLLYWLEKRGEAVIFDNQVRAMLRGEALAVRAYLHFDLLRGWGPMHYAGSEEARQTRSIPYREVTDNSKQPLLSAQEVVNRVLRDLLEARQALSYEKNSSLEENHGDRRFRLGYHAVNALLARVYAYAGEEEKAAACAKEVIEHCGLSLKSDNSTDPALYAETLFGVHLYDMKVQLSNRFSVGDKLPVKNYCDFTTLNAIFQTSGTESEDMRAKSTAFYKSSDEQKALTLKYSRNDKEIIPLIRLPEMYYILCETSPLANSAPYLNRVRNMRGISSSANENYSDKQGRQAALEREYRKEFYAEGQYFFFLKTRGITGALPHHPEVRLEREEFVFPLPDAEKEYGWTEENKTAATEG